MASADCETKHAQNTIESLFSKLEAKTPNTVEINAEHGITQDIYWTCEAESQKEFEQQFLKGLKSLGIDLGDAKQRVYQSRIEVSEEGTKICFQRNSEEEWQEIIINGIQLQQKSPLYGGGSFNLLRTLDKLISIIPLLEAKHPEIAPHLKKAQQRVPHAKAILKEDKIKDLGLSNVEIETIPGEIRTSNCFYLFGKPFYLTDRTARPSEEKEVSPLSIMNTTRESISLVCQTVCETDLRAFNHSQREREYNNQSIDNLFLLLPKDLIDRGIDDKALRDMLAKTHIVSFNLYEAAKLCNLIPIEQYTPPEFREKTAQYVAQQLHKLGVGTVIITDEDKGSYVSSKHGTTNGHFYWSKFDIDREMPAWIEGFQDSLSATGADQIIPKGEKLNATGCGDSFAATVQFCVQILGLRNWDFIINFANKIAGLVLHLKQANIGDIDEAKIFELFKKGARTKKDQPWKAISSARDLTDYFATNTNDNYEKGQKDHYLPNIQWGVLHEAIILVGEPGVGKHELVDAIKANLLETVEDNPLHKLTQEFNFRLNGITPISTSEDIKDVQENENKITPEEFDRRLQAGMLIGETNRPDGSRYAFNREEFEYNKTHKDTVEVVIADSPEQARNLWMALMKELHITRVKIVNIEKSLTDTKESHTSGHRKRIANQSGGFTFSLRESPEIAANDLVQELATSLQESRKHALS